MFLILENNKNSTKGITKFTCFMCIVDIGIETLDILETTLD